MGSIGLLDELFSQSLENELDFLLGDFLLTSKADTPCVPYQVTKIFITGDSNTMDLDQGTNLSAERLDFDLTVIGDSNVFDVDIDVDDAVWNFDITGGSNNINTMQKDGAEQEINLTLVGSSADVDINQMSGTCPQGVSTCNGIITLDIDSENATIQINQKDATNDS